MGELPYELAEVGEQGHRYDGGVLVGPPVAVARAKTCVISCVGMDLNPSRFALAVKHGPPRRFRKQKCPICGRRASVVFQLIER